MSKLFCNYVFSDLKRPLMLPFNRSIYFCTLPIPEYSSLYNKVLETLYNSHYVHLLIFVSMCLKNYKLNRECIAVNGTIYST